MDLWGHRVLTFSTLPDIVNCFLRCLYTVSALPHVHQGLILPSIDIFVSLEDAKWNILCL